MVQLYEGVWLVPIKVEHEWDKKTTRHRLNVMFYYEGMPSHATATFGDWCDYRSPATVKWSDRTFVYFSDYYRGYVPTEQILELTTYDEQSM